MNEAETIATCIEKAQAFLSDFNVSGEVVVADNGSTDGSQDLARKSGARVIDVNQKGYGSALMGGLKEAHGQFIIMADADDSYDLYHLDGFLEQLRRGCDLVMGNRFRGGIKPGAMPFLHRHIGNPLLSILGRLFYKSPVKDFHCGLRGFRKQAILDLDLRTTGMEFASEMVVKASLFGLKIAEVPTTLSPAGRSRPPHLRTWRDGWRHLRFLMLYSPRWLFLYPGMFLVAVGTGLTILLLLGPLRIGGLAFDIHTMLYTAMSIILGYQSIQFAVFSRVFAVTEGLMPANPTLERLFRVIKLETGLAAGVILIVFGFAMTIYSLATWGSVDFGELDPRVTFRLVIPAILSIILGVQTILSSFFLSVLGLSRRS